MLTSCGGGRLKLSNTLSRRFTCFFSGGECMNKKVLKYGAGVFAIVCFVFLVKFIKEELRYNWYTRVFEYPYIVPFFLLSFGVFWGFVLFIAIKQDSESPKTSSACNGPEEPNPYETPFQMMMRKVKGEDTQKQEDSQE